jgi:hypothetical protein
MKKRANPKPSDLELIAGGVSAIALVALGITMVYKATNQSSNSSSILQDTSSLTALSAVVPL